jgi:hypothetical protein
MHSKSKMRSLASLDELSVNVPCMVCYDKDTGLIVLMLYLDNVSDGAGTRLGKMRPGLFHRVQHVVRRDENYAHRQGPTNRYLLRLAHLRLYNQLSAERDKVAILCLSPDTPVSAFFRYDTGRFAMPARHAADGGY